MIIHGTVYIIKNTICTKYSHSNNKHVTFLLTEKQSKLAGSSLFTLVASIELQSNRAMSCCWSGLRHKSLRASFGKVSRTLSKCKQDFRRTVDELIFNEMKINLLASTEFSPQVLFKNFEQSSATHQHGPYKLLNRDQSKLGYGQKYWKVSLFSPTKSITQPPPPRTPLQKINK